jgi:hypothetical protein
MNPVMGLGLAETALQAVQGLPGGGLLIDENEQEFVFHRFVGRVKGGIGGNKRGQQTVKLFRVESGGCQKLFGSVFYGFVGEHTVIITDSKGWC